MSLTGDSIPGWTAPVQPAITVAPQAVQGLYDVSSAIKGTTYEFQGRMITSFISCTLFGILVSCTIVTAILLVPRCRKNMFSVMLLLATAAMFAGTTAYWIISLQHLSNDATGVVNDVNQIVADIECLQPTGGITPNRCLHDPQASATYNGAAPNMLQLCTGTAALTVNVVIGDMIVWWRACVIWHDRKLVRVVGAVLILATLAMGSVSTSHACAGPDDIPLSSVEGFDKGSFSLTPGSLFEGDNFGIAASALSLTNNLCATVLIAYKAWQHKLSWRGLLDSAPGHSRSDVGRALSLLIESGIVYCVIWLVVAVYQGLAAPSFRVGFNPTGRDTLHTFLTGFEIFTEGALVTIIAIYPMLIVIVVSLRRSQNQSVFGRNDGSKAPPVRSTIIFQSATRTGSTTATMSTGDTAHSRPPSTVFREEGPVVDTEKVQKSSSNSVDVENLRA